MNDPRAELTWLTEALRGHLEWAQMTGSVGVLPASEQWIERRREQYRALEVEVDVADAGVETSSSQPAPRRDVDASLPDSELPQNDGVPSSSPTRHPAEAAATAPVPERTLVAPDELPGRTEAASDATSRATTPLPSAAPASAIQTTPAAPPSSHPLPEDRVRRLEVLREEVAQCTRCGLHETRTNTVFARGDGTSGICFVGEGPGQDEDLQGSPFVGKAGQLLDRMIAAMGLSREEVYICNIVKCRPPKNRKPEASEMRACRGYLEDQLEAVAPQVIVALGATAVEGLLGLSMGITRMRGQWRLYQGKIPVMPTFHPAYLLRQPGAKREVWDDLKQVLDHVGRQVPQRRR